MLYSPETIQKTIDNETSVRSKCFSMTISLYFIIMLHYIVRYYNKSYTFLFKTQNRLTNLSSKLKKCFNNKNQLPKVGGIPVFGHLLDVIVYVILN